MVGRVSATIWGTSEWTKLFKWRTEKRRGLRGLGKTAQLCLSTITCVSKRDPLRRWQHELNWRTFGSPDLTNFSSQMFLAGAKNSHQSYECVNGKRQPRGVLFTMIAQWEGKLLEMCISPLFLSSCWLVYKLELLTGLCSFLWRDYSCLHSRPVTSFGWQSRSRTHWKSNSHSVFHGDNTPVRSVPIKDCIIFIFSLL